MKYTVVTVDLSEEEVLYLLSLTQVPTLPGVDMAAFLELRPEAQAFALGAGERALEARGALAPDPTVRTGVAVREDVLGLMGTCVMADGLLLVDREPFAGDGDARYYHLGSYLSVEHSVARGVHTLRGMVPGAPTAERVAQQVGLHDGVERHPLSGAPAPVRIHQQVLKRARDQAVDLHDVAAAAATLVSAGVNDAVAAGMARQLSRLEAVTTVALLRRNGDDIGSEGFVILDCGDGVWLLTPPSDDEQMAICTQVNAEDLFNRLALLLRSFDPPVAADQ
jgi:hypothetical protein